MLILCNRKDKFPKETITLIKNILKQNGVNVKESRIINVKNSIFSIRIELKDIPGIGTNGKGISKEYARASAYAEFMERLQSGFLIKPFYLNKQIEEKFFKDEHVVEYNKIIENESNSNLLKFLKNNSKYRCMSTFYNVFGEYYVDLPIKLINALTHSNGLCAGNSQAEAITQGICEIFERYCYKKILFDECELPTINVDNIEELSVYTQLMQLKALGFHYEIKDCSIDGKFPVVGIIIYNTLKDKYLFSIGADIDFDIAMQRCITEIFQGLSIKKIGLKMKSVLNNYKENKKRYGNEFLMLNWLRCYSSNSGIHSSNIFSSNKKINIKNLPFRKVESNQKAMEMLYQILKKENLELFIKNYSFMGFETYKIYIPGISEIDEIDALKLNLSKSFDSLRNTYFNMYDAINVLSEKDERLLFEMSNKVKYKAFMLPSKVFNADNNIKCDYIKLNFFYILLIYLSINGRYEKISKYVRLKLKEDQLNEYEIKYLLCIRDLIKKNTSLSNYPSRVIRDCKRLLFDTKKYLICLKAPACPNCYKCPSKNKCQYSNWLKLNSKVKEAMLK